MLLKLHIYSYFVVVVHFLLQLNALLLCGIALHVHVSRNLLKLLSTFLTFFLIPKKYFAKLLKSKQLFYRNL